MRKTQRDYLEEQLDIANSAKKWKIMKDLVIKTTSTTDSTSKLFINELIKKYLKILLMHTMTILLK